MRSDCGNVLLIIAIATSAFLNTMCEPSPKFLPAGNYELIKLLDSKEDLVYPFFLDDNRIIFYSRNGDLNYKIWETDTIGINTKTIFNDQSSWIEGFPSINESCTNIAYTAGDFVSVDLDTMALVNIAYRIMGDQKPTGARLLKCDVYTQNIITGEKKQRTNNRSSHFIRWLDNDRILAAVTGYDEPVVMTTDRRVEHGGGGIGWALGNELVLSPEEFVVIDARSDSVERISPDENLFLVKRVEKPTDISLLDDTLIQISRMHSERRENRPRMLGKISIQDSAQYIVIWADSSRIMLARMYTDTRDRFREKYNIIVVNLNTYDWTTIAKGIPKNLLQDIRITGNDILVVNGDYRLGKILFDGKSQIFLETNESVRLRGMSASPSGRMFVVSAGWAGSKGYDLYLFKKEAGD
jgi:hypothetical protein